MRRINAAIKIVVLASLLCGLSAFAEDEASPFAIEPALRERVLFWEQIYSKYNSWDLVVHDQKHPEIVYAVIDKTKEPARFPKEKKLISAALKSLSLKQEKLENGQLSPDRLNAEEKKIYDLFLHIKEPNKFTDALEKGRIHGQLGLRDGLKRTLYVSGRYLQRMQHVFESFDLPGELAYLPFVESGFNDAIVSRVGASGIWQFMPYTGKLFLRVDDVVDERNDPMRSAEAAARLLKQNYSQLKDWPLAITAYNHGVTGIATAVRETGSHSLATIIERYTGKNFGYASENYYCSFVGALHVAKNSEFFLGEKIDRARLIEFDEFVMPHYMAVQTFVDYLGIKMEDFRELNPALTPLVYSGNRYIPVGYTVRVPVSSRTDFLSKYDKIPEQFKHSEQKIDLQEAPQEGDKPVG